MIFIVLKAQIRPEKRDEWLVAIEQYTADVRGEPGNLSFDWYENGGDACEFAIIETFQDAGAGEAHVATRHAQDFFAAMPALVTARPQVNYQELDGNAWSEMSEVTPE
ncbi:MAG: putative quinol monooxygenase [Pseudonocardia sp.]